MIVAFTGHRPAKLGGYNPENPTRKAVQAVLRKILTTVEPMPETAISGMAQGFDQDAFRVCLDLDIPVWAAVPFHGQEARWPEPAQREYHALLQLAARVVYVTERVDGVREAMLALEARNHWMIDNSDALVAAWDGSPGGTRNCIHYAAKLHRPMLFINPMEPWFLLDIVRQAQTTLRWELRS